MEGYNIDNEVIKYIATNIKSNIRELEGALTKIVALSRKEGDSFEINITATTPVNTLLLQEDIQNGQRIEAFTVEASINGVWEKISEGTTIGYKRLVRFDDVIADKLRVTINRTRADFSILRTGIFYANPIIEKSEEAQNSVFTPQECLI